jgi:hypothetical protein
MNTYIFNVYSFGNWEKTVGVLADNENDAYNKAERRYPGTSVSLFYYFKPTDFIK